MNESSVLRPRGQTRQSNAAIVKLEQDNDFLRQAKEAMSAFINDNSIRSQGYSNLKRKMEDYVKVADAFIKANTMDIMDHRKLIGLVGEENLIGARILRRIETRKQRRSYLEGRLEHLRRARDNNIFDELSAFSSINSAARGEIAAMVSKFEGLLNNNNEILYNYEKKAERYNEICQATRELFVEGAELRAGAIKGIGLIRQASAGLPDSFQSDVLSVWRTNMQDKKDRGIEKLIRRVAIKDDEGNVIGYNWDLLEKLDYATLLSVIKNVEGLEGYNWIINSVDQAKLYLAEWREFWNLSEEVDRRELLIEKLKNYRMMEAIRLVDSDERFSLEVWTAATVAERRAILENYMSALVDIFGVDVNSQITFTNTPPNEQGGVNLGSYRHRGREVSVNEWILENWDAERSHNRLLDTVRHELRHAYQNSVNDNPEQFRTSAATSEAWRANLPPAGYYKSTSRGYSWVDYRNQPIEVDAFSFGRFEKWRKE